MDNRARYRVGTEDFPSSMPIYDSYTNTQLTLSYVADLLNQLTDKPEKKNGNIINLTLNFYGSDMTLDKVMGIIERTTREILQ